jgi:hypothetical protein
MFMLKSLIVLLLFVVPPLCFGQDSYVPDDKIPTELRPFIVPGTKLLAVESADLNGDNLIDYVFILEKQKKNPSDPEIEEGQRPLHIAIRLKDGTLKVVKTNDKVVLCSTCGGVFGDPFAGLIIKKKSFSVQHYGGSNWRWANTYQFNYSRIDDTWQLVLVEEVSFHTSNPDKQKRRSYKPPRDYGKIDIAEFDPEHFRKKRGARFD